MTAHEPENIPAGIPGESDGALLARLGTDAQAWSDEFLYTLDALDRDAPPPQIDERWLTLWFANAIAAGRAVDALERVRAVAVADAWLEGTLLDVDNFAGDAWEQYRREHPRGTS